MTATERMEKRKKKEKKMKKEKKNKKEEKNKKRNIKKRNEERGGGKESIKTCSLRTSVDACC